MSSKQIYSGFARFGRFTATFGLVISVIFGIMMILGGIILLFRKPKQRHVKGTILNEPTCVLGYNNIFNCADVEVEYVVGNKAYKNNTSSTNSHFLKKGETIDIYYQEGSPDVVTTSKIPSNWVIVLLMLVGVIVMGISAFWRYLVIHSTDVAAISGVSTVARYMI